MPVHDWTSVDVGIFHAFHMGWIVHLSESLNSDLSPYGYYAMPEQQMDWRMPIRHVSGHRIVALVKILSPANKDRARDEEFLNVKGALAQKVNLLLINLFPPGAYDPGEMYGGLWDCDEFDEPLVDEPLVAASYVGSGLDYVDIRHFSVGASLPEMPLFLSPERYINAPLEATYEMAFRGLAEFWRRVLEGHAPTP